jgi:hypothetical protein
MKPLPSAPLTEEDVRIWWSLAPGTGYVDDSDFWDGYFRGDRRDANKMYRRMQSQFECMVEGYDWRTERRGWFPSMWGLPDEPSINPTTT